MRIGPATKFELESNNMVDLSKATAHYVKVFLPIYEQMMKEYIRG